VHPLQPLYWLCLFILGEISIINLFKLSAKLTGQCGASAVGVINIKQQTIAILLAAITKQRKIFIGCKSNYSHLHKINYLPGLFCTVVYKCFITCKP